MHKYEITLKWEKNTEVPYWRKAILSAKELPDIIVATPPEFKQGIPGLWSPEHLFIASASVCLTTTFLSISQASRLDYKTFFIETTGTLEDVEEDGKTVSQITKIHQKFHLKLVDPKDEKKAEKVLKKSKENCLIANSMKTEVSTELVFD